jgi:FlaA1/EpsC-like NDP-sugar epimerase
MRYYSSFWDFFKNSVFGAVYTVGVLVSAWVLFLVVLSYPQYLKLGIALYVLVWVLITLFAAAAQRILKGRCDREEELLAEKAKANMPPNHFTIKQQLSHFILSGKKILVLDDEHEYRQLCQAICKQMTDVAENRFCINTNSLKDVELLLLEAADGGKFYKLTALVK